MLQDDGEGVQPVPILAGGQQIGVVMLGGMGAWKMRMDDGSVPLTRTVVVVVLSLGRVDVQEGRGKERQEKSQCCRGRQRAPHDCIVDDRPSRRQARRRSCLTLRL
jgi:hypothetical protein